MVYVFDIVGCFFRQIVVEMFIKLKKKRRTLEFIVNRPKVLKKSNIKN